jgi:hypothetical protein
MARTSSNAHMGGMIKSPSSERLAGVADSPAYVGPFGHAGIDPDADPVAATTGAMDYVDQYCVIHCAG